MELNEEMTFTNISTALRAPRVAILISEDQWERQAFWAIQILSKIWGGSGGVIIPVREDNSVHPEVLSALKMYDPDYISPLYLSGTQFEEIRPGFIQIKINGRKVHAPSRRKKFLEDPSMHRHGIGTLIPNAAVTSLLNELATFKGEDNERVLRLDTDSPIVRPLTPSKMEIPLEGFIGTTGVPHLDLAVASRIGQARNVNSSVDLKTLSDYELWHLLFTKDRQSTKEFPFRATETLLERIFATSRSLDAVTIVFGKASADFSLAMILDRLLGHITWIPDVMGLKKQRAAAANTLSSEVVRSYEPLRALSTSLSSIQLTNTLQLLWTYRQIRPIPDEPLTIEIANAIHHASYSTSTYCLKDSWDRRRGIPIARSNNGSSEMLSPLLSDLPLHLEQSDLSWIVEIFRHDQALPISSSLDTRLILAKDQNPRETFVRASRGAIAYEKGRWDFFHVGASVSGRIAAPRLRWPSTQEILQSAAAKNGKSIRLSDAGKRASTIIRLWGSREDLVSDLENTSRTILNCFIPPSNKNGPYDHGIGIGGSGFCTFKKMLSVANTQWDSKTLRDWIDEKCTLGILRRGLLLRCELCSILDFVLIDDLAKSNRCTRCGHYNPLTRERWTSPKHGQDEEPEWFYGIHPSIPALFEQEGDLPILAWHRYAAGSRAAIMPWHEFEVCNENGESSVEFDFVGQVGTRLLVGEAKLGNSLHTQNKRERDRKARKIVEGALDLGAHEICLATTSAWNDASKDSMRMALLGERESQLHITLLERLHEVNARPMPFT